MDNVLSLNNSSLVTLLTASIPLSLKDTDRSTSYLALHLEIDSEGRLRTKLNAKRDDFNLPIVNFPFICSNIPAASAYGLYIPQLIQYSRACDSYQDIVDRGLLLTWKLLICFENRWMQTVVMDVKNTVIFFIVALMYCTCHMMTEFSRCSIQTW
jgi:hypothetical protein